VQHLLPQDPSHTPILHITVTVNACLYVWMLDQAVCVVHAPWPCSRHLDLPACLTAPLLVLLTECVHGCVWVADVTA
jgi:hypothetical protein